MIFAPGQWVWVMAVAYGLRRWQRLPRSFLLVVADAAGVCSQKKTATRINLVAV